MKRENSTLADDSSDEEQIIEEPPYMLAMSSGEARKDRLTLTTQFYLLLFIYYDSITIIFDHN